MDIVEYEKKIGHQPCSHFKTIRIKCPLCIWTDAQEDKELHALIERNSREFASLYKKKARKKLAQELMNEHGDWFEDAILEGIYELTPLKEKLEKIIGKKHHWKGE